MESRSVRRVAVALALIATGSVLGWKAHRLRQDPRFAVQAYGTLIAAGLLREEREEYPLIPLQNLADGQFHAPKACTEGIVTETVHRIKDGDWHVNLVEGPKSLKALVVEFVPRLPDIRTGKPMAVPEIGDRIIVCGVIRFDNFVDNQWWEVHPVLWWDKISP